jgi:hypothetical protein
MRILMRISRPDLLFIEMDNNLEVILEFLEAEKKRYRIKLVQYLEMQMKVPPGIARAPIIHKV